MRWMCSIEPWTDCSLWGCLTKCRLTDCDCATDDAMHQHMCGCYNETPLARLHTRLWGGRHPAASQAGEQKAATLQTAHTLVARDTRQPQVAHSTGMSTLHTVRFTEHRGAWSGPENQPAFAQAGQADAFLHLPQATAVPRTPHA